MLKMHIFLVGMAGAGKTSLGQAFGYQPEYPFVDTDQRISEIMGMSVIEIFQTLGEQFFRNAEARRADGADWQAPVRGVYRRWPGPPCAKTCC